MSQLIAHRGGSGERMENTLAAFTHAIECNAAGAELDVQLTRDGHVVVHHDDQLNPGFCRDRNGHWIDPDKPLLIADLDLDYLKTFDLGATKPNSAYAKKFPHILPQGKQYVPLLSEVLELVKSRSDSFKLVIEIKTPILQAAHQPWIQLVEKTLAQVKQADFFERTILCSFDWASLLYAKSLYPALATWFTSNPLSWYQNTKPPQRDIPPNDSKLAQIRTLYQTCKAPWYGGFAPQDYAHNELEAAAAAGASAWFPYYADITPERIHAMQTLGLESAAWSVNLTDKSQLAALKASGTQFLCMDYLSL